MALNDPVDKNLRRMEGRRFAARCEALVSSIERADTLREVARLVVSISLPYSLVEDFSARDAMRVMQTRGEDRARELVQEQIQNFVRAEDNLRDKQRRAMLDAWANLTGPLAHLRNWAQSKFTAAEQQLK